MSHSCPSGRPVHPECERLDDSTLMCTCDDAWDGVYGVDLDKAIQMAERMEARRKPAALDHAPDRDDADVEEPTPEVRAPVPAGEDYDGFWKHSEYLKCRAGKPLQELRNYGRGPTWLRAEESRK